MTEANYSGLVFWILVVAGVCLATILIGCLGAIINVSHLESEREREAGEL